MHKLHYVIMLVLVTLASGELQAAKPGGGTPPPSGSACVGQLGEFPAMAFARGVFATNGSYGRTQIFVANSFGTCEVMVYDSGNYDRSAISGLSFHFDAGSGTGTLAWSQVRDNGERYGTGRQVVKVARFQVVGGAVGLPVSAVTVYRSPVDGLAISDVALSPNAARLAFSTEQATSTAGVWLYQVLMCDLPSPSCAPAVEFASTTVKALDLAIGRNLTSGAERVYFDNAHRDVRMIERSDVGWSAQILVSSVDYTGESSVQLYEPSVLSMAGQDDRVLFTSRAGSGAWRVDIYDVANAIPLTRSVGDGYGPSWTLSPSIDEIAPNTLVASLPGSSTSAIQEIDLDSHPEVSLPAVSGYGVDSAY